ncbi:putative baseplate assembly protein [Leptolyngbya sp. FACHB-671]|uniref:putative baseplate assembly protein n=1 Tax=Leptolyngbya sp. FACHB-671 TaxID=2692812 RepID=UPI001685A942|nr:putative baseplate assembly protein [Leptolyngbya sp. FACHB-671]MBD2066019.1 putative baseplate assembly protein [Leptolyngbya sp. FACHB-671]
MNDDTAIALLDAWAVVADVLTFYQERIANEGYLRTATERLSVLELARAIGYELNPGVAASTFLTFNVEDVPGSPRVATIPKGTQIMSIPSKNELPQTFETSENFTAYADWNALTPRSTRPQKITSNTRQLYLNSISTQLQAGDFVLLIDEEREIHTYLLPLTEVVQNSQAGYTLVQWEESLPEITTPLRNPKVFAFRQRANLFGHNAPDWEQMPAEIKLAVIADKGKLDLLQGGIFHTENHGDTWNAASKGLPNADILCLIIRDGVLFAGTAGKGIFRSMDNGNTWEAVNNGLTNLNIQALYTAPDGRSPLFAGTPGGGVFRSKDGGENWVPINTGNVRVEGQGSTNWQSVNTRLPNSIVRSILTYTAEDSYGTGTLFIEGTTVTGYGTEFTKELKTSNTITVNVEGEPQTIAVKQVFSDTLLTINDPFTPSVIPLGTSFQLSTPVERSYIFVGTDEGIYRSHNQGNDWIARNLTNNVVYSLLYKKSYLFAGTDKGLYRSSDHGESWNLIQQEENNSSSFNERAVFALIANESFIFAGTDAGIFYSSTQGNKWQAINISQNDKKNTFKIYKIRSLSTYNYDKTYYLFAATEQGVFCLKYTDNDVKIVKEFLIFGYNKLYRELQNNQLIDSETLDLWLVSLVYYLISGIAVQWTQVSEGLPTQDMTALACNEAQKPLFAGSKFAGFLQSDIETQTKNRVNSITPQTNKKEEWPDFKLQSNQIDFDTLYPQILPKSWIVLLDKGNSINQDNNQLTVAVRQVKSTSTITQNDFGLTAKIIRIEPNKAVEHSDKFKLRSTVVLSRSEELDLAKERLTVSERQQEIFQDPIQGNTVFLNQFVQGLQPNQTVIVSGKHLRVQLNDIGGVCHLGAETKPESIRWKKINRGLTNSQVRSLASNPQGNVIWAGTTEGIFHSFDKGEYWQPVDSWENINKTLKKKEIQALLTKPSNDSTQPDLIFVGTTEGIFRSNNGGNQWQKINQEQGLTYTDIRVIAFTSQSKTLLVGTINGGVLQSQDDGENWTTTRLTGTDVQALVVKQCTDELIAGTVRDGVFYSTNNGSTWQQFTEIRQGKGTISSDGNQVTWIGSNFNQQLQHGDIINAADQSRTIIDSNPDSNSVTFTVDEPFRPDLLPGTAFTVNTGLTNRNITAVAIAQNYLFAGTAGSGVFRSKDNGDRWEQVNTNLTDLEIRCLTVDADGKVWVGTSKRGVFYSDNQGELWTPANTNLNNIDVQAILIPHGSKNIFVGGIGILLSLDGFETKPVQRRDVVQLIEPPTSLPNTSIPYQQWKVMDKDGFQGNLRTTQYDAIGVESSDSKDVVSPQLTLLPAAAESEVVSEVANIQLPPTGQQMPVLTLQQPLKYSYDPATVQVYANVVQATHGQTVEEVIGSGDGHQTNQCFALKKPPLTYVPTITASGAKSTLEVRVNGVLWQEVPSLYPLTPQDQSYIIRIEDDGTTTVTFGDGIQGARLPSGNENITATYRSGIGLDGNIAATRLSLLKTRPQGIVQVNNPIPATGAAPAESLEEARAKAPPTVRTLDRIVSLGDFEDFARGFAGIGKAQAVALWHEENHIVHLTIAAVGGESVLPESSLYTNLIKAINQARDPLQQVQIDSYDRILFNLEARLLINPRYQPEEVKNKVLTALKTTFAFPRRQFGQNVTAAEAVATMQNVEGVIAVDLDALYPSGRSKALVQSLPAFQARSDPRTNQVYPAQLLLFNPAGIKLVIVPTL